MIQKVLVMFQGKEDYQNLLDSLGQAGYRWLSGEPANQPPRLLRPEHSENKYGFRRLDLDAKTIGFVPIEAYSGEELIHMTEEAYAVPTVINRFIEKEKTQEEFIR